MPTVLLKKTMNWTAALWIGSALGTAAITLADDASAGSPIVLEKIECEGNTRSSCEDMIQKSGLVAGQTLQDEQVQDARYKLKMTGLYEEIDARLDKGSEPGKATLVLTIKEASPYSVYTSAGALKSRHGHSELLDATASNRNLTGRGDPLSIRLRAQHADVSAKYKHYNSDGMTERSNQFLSNQAIGRAEYTRSGLLGDRSFITLGSTFSIVSATDTYANSGNPTTLIYPITKFNLSSDIALGLKAFQYSYFNIGMNYIWFSKDVYRTVYHDYRPNTSSFQPAYFIEYGWDSQDSLLFPTEGSRFQLRGVYTEAPKGYFYSATEHRGTIDQGVINLILTYKKHFELTKNHVMTFLLGQQVANDLTLYSSESPELGLRYAYHFKRNAKVGLSNGLVYIEPGFYRSSFELSTTPTGGGGAAASSDQVGLGLRIGTTFQTQFMTFNFFLTGTQ